MTLILHPNSTPPFLYALSWLWAEAPDIIETTEVWTLYRNGINDTTYEYDGTLSIKGAGINSLDMKETKK